MKVNHSPQHKQRICLPEMFLSCSKAAAASGSVRVTGLKQAVASHRALASLVATYQQTRVNASSNATICSTYKRITGNASPLLGGTFESSFSTNSGRSVANNPARARKKVKIEKHGPDLKEFMQKVIDF